MYIQDGNGMDRVITKEYPTLANAVIHPSIATWGGANDAVYSNFVCRVGDNVEPAAPTVPYSVINGLKYYDVSDFSEGKAAYIYTGSGSKTLEINAPVGVEDDVYVETVLKKGKKFDMSDLRLGFMLGKLNMTLISSEKNGIQLQMTDWKFYESYKLNDAQVEAFEGAGLRVGAARINGVYYMYVQDGNGMDRVVTKTVADYAKASFNIKLATWETAQGAIYSGLNWKIGKDVEPAAPTVPYPVLNGIHYYDVSDFSNGNVTYIYTGSGDKALELNAPVGVEEDVYVEAVLKKGENFYMSDLRYGFRFASLNLDIVSSTKNGMQLQMTNWKEHAYYNLTNAQVEAFEGKGLKVGAARVDGKFRMYIENGNGMDCVLEKEYETYANSSFNIKLATWDSAKGAVYSGLNWKIGENVTPDASTPIITGTEYYDVTNIQNGTVTYTGSGERVLELNAAVGTNDDVYVEAVLKKGEEFDMSNLRLGFRFADLNLNVVSSTAYGLQLQMTNWKERAYYNFTDAQKAAFEGNGLKVGAARIDGKFYMYIENGNGMDCVVEKAYTAYAKSSFDIKLVTWTEAKGAVYSGLNWKIGEDVAPAASIPVVSGNEYYEIKDGVVTYTYTGSGDKALELNAAVGANDDVYVEAVLKKGNNFNMSDLRYGFRFSSLNLNVVSNTKEGLRLQMTAWDKRYPTYTLTEAQKAAYEGEGLRVGAARIDGKFYMYIENGNSMDCVLEEEYTKYATSAFNIKLATWNSAPGAVYSGLKWKIGENVAP